MNQRLGLFALGAALVLAWPGMAAAQSPKVVKVRATRVGDSDWIRIDWSMDDPQSSVKCEIRRTSYQPGKAPETRLVGVTSGRPDVRVFVDKDKKEAGVEYAYEARPVSATGDGACASAKVALNGFFDREVARHLDFDDGRLSNPDPLGSSSRPDAANPAPSWILKDGRLDWLAGDERETSRLILDPSGSGVQITARIAILGAFPPEDCDGGVGVGLRAKDGAKIVSLVVRESGPDADGVAIHFQHQSIAKAGDPPVGSLLPNADDAPGVHFNIPGRDPDSEPANLTWLWLKMNVDDGEFKGKAWLDADAEPDDWAIETRAFENTGWDDARAVLLGRSGPMRASFGEVFVETTPPAEDAIEPDRPAPAIEEGAGSPNETEPEVAAAAAEPEDPVEIARKARLSAVPFNDLPTIVRLVARGSLRPDERDQVEDGPPELGTAKDPARHFDFARPAHFPLPRFDECDDEAGDEGVVIYEGMRLDVASDGRYEVRFVATTPATPVTLRLQFRLEQRDGSERTVTIPAIDILPPTDHRGQYQTATWKIRHQGYSYNLATVATPLIRDSQGRDQLHEYDDKGSRVADYRLARRIGTARFGSRPSPAY